MTPDDIAFLLERLSTQDADSLETQELDFKEWPSSLKEGLDKAVEMAVCMANGGGGTVIFGVRDRVVGRKNAIVGVPVDLETNQLQRAVYDRTDPRLTPTFHVHAVPEGTGRVICMVVFPGMPPYTDAAGAAKIRVGKECKPLTGSHRQSLLSVSGAGDWSAREISRPLETLVSAAAVDAIKRLSARQGLPNETLSLSDLDFLSSIGVVRNGRLTNAGLLLAGKEEQMEEHAPNHLWTYLRMQSSETDYSLREDGRSPLGLALPRLEELMRAENPSLTVKDGLLHYEYRRWPEEALREALMNAICHRDYGLGGPLVVKQGDDVLSISNPGGFVGGVTAENILQHTPVSRNPHLVEVLLKLRLVNRSNVGVKRMFRLLLIEGKEPPSFETTPHSVLVRFLRSHLSPGFRSFVSEEAQRGRDFRVEELLVLQKLMHCSHVSAKDISRIIQRQEAAAFQLLSSLEVADGYLCRTRSETEVSWELNALLKRLLTPQRSSAGENVAPNHKKSLDIDSQVLAALKEDSRHGGQGLTNQQLRERFKLSRDDVLSVIHRLMLSHAEVRMTGKRGRGSRYIFENLAQ